MAVWICIEDEDDFYLLRSTLERSVERRQGLLPPELQAMYTNVLQAFKEATKDVPDSRPVQVEVGTQNRIKKERKKRAPNGSVAKMVLCEDHPTWGGVRRPRTDCDKCWKEYEKLHGKDPMGREAVRRKLREKTTKSV